MRHFVEVGVDVLAMGEREVLVRRRVGGKEAILSLAHEIELTPPRHDSLATHWKLVLPMEAAKSHGLVE